jgi:hypothetical protein
MGSGASTLERSSSAAFGELDADGSGTISIDEFGAAARAVGMALKDDEIKEVFAKYDADGSGEIDASEFQRFFDERQSEFHDEDKTIVEKLSPEGLRSIVPYIGPQEASRGFKKAHLILERNPKAADAPMSEAVPLRPLHLLLLLDSPCEEGASGKARQASTAAACKAAGPLISHVLKCAPQVAALRVQKKPDGGCPVGNLALHLALQRRWPAAVVKEVADAYPEALKTLDAVKVKRSKKKGGKGGGGGDGGGGAAVAVEEDVPPVPKKGKGRWARGVAEESGCAADVLALLPAPKRNKKTKELEWVWVEVEVSAASAAAAASAGAGKKKGKK